MESTSANNRTIPSDKLDIIIYDKENRTFVLIDVAVSGDRHVIKKKS
jgi:hypothetical protein